MCRAFHSDSLSPRRPDPPDSRTRSTEGLTTLSVPSLRAQFPCQKAYPKLLFTSTSSPWTRALRTIQGATTTAAGTAIHKVRRIRARHPEPVPTASTAPGAASARIGSVSASNPSANPHEAAVRSQPRRPAR